MEDSKDYINVRQPTFSKNNEGFYFIADIGTEKNTTASAVYYLEFSTKKIKKIWNKKDGQAINLYRNKALK
jgi:hypothetical protein